MSIMGVVYREKSKHLDSESTISSPFNRISETSNGVGASERPQTAKHSAMWSDAPPFKDKSFMILRVKNVVQEQLQAHTNCYSIR